MKYKYIFWDWNGTIFSDAGAAHQAVNTMLESRNLPSITFRQYRENIDVPIIRFYEKFMDMSKEDMKSLSAEFNALWASYLPVEPLSEGIVDILHSFHQSGIKQYIFSSSHTDLITPYLHKFGIAQYFTAVLGASDCYVGSKAERTRAYLISNGISPEESLFVGDMVHDSDVAEFVGADCVLISSGHQCGKSLVSSGRKVISTVRELPQLLKRL